MHSSLRSQPSASSPPLPTQPSAPSPPLPTLRSPPSARSLLRPPPALLRVPPPALRPPPALPRTLRPLSLHLPPAPQSLPSPSAAQQESQAKASPPSPPALVLCGRLTCRQICEWMAPRRSRSPRRFPRPLCTRFDSPAARWTRRAAADSPLRSSARPSRISISKATALAMTGPMR